MSSSHLSERQREAVHEAKHHVAVQAAAGSGKTRVLVERVLRHLLEEEALPHEVLAITFTNRATAEMKSRVRGRLREIAGGDLSQKRRDQALRCLEDFHRATVMTIHAFANEVLRSHPFEDNLDPSYAIQDEHLSEQARRDVVLELTQELLSAREENPLRLDVIHLLRTSGTAGLESLIEIVSSTGITDGDLRDQLRGDAVGLLEQLRSEWASHATPLIDGLMRTSGVSRALRDGSAAVSTGHRGGTDQPVHRWPAIAETLLSDQSIGERAAAMDELLPLVLTTGNTARKKLTDPVHGGASDWDQPARNKLQEIVKVIGAVAEPLKPKWISWREECEMQGALLLRALASLALEARRRLRLRKEREGWLDFSDQLQRAADLAEREPANVARPLAERFRAILIDEFQDTDPAQWRLVRALLGQGTSLPVMLVGDPRQSIYGFRGADVRVFDEARRELRDSVSEDNHLDVDLAESYRATAPLVESVVGIFEQLLRAPDLEQRAVMPSPRMEAMSDQEGFPASIHLIPVSDQEKDPRGAEAEAIANAIAALVDSPGVWSEKVWGDAFSEKHRVKWGDIALLFRTGKHLGAYQRALTACAIPHVVASSDGLTQRQEIWDLTHLLRTLVEPSDDAALAGLLRTPWMGWSDDLLLKVTLLTDGIAPRQSRPLWDRLEAAQTAEHEMISLGTEDRAVIARTRRLILDARATCLHTSPAETVERFFSETGAWGLIRMEPDGARRVANLRRGLSRLRRTGARGFGALLDAADDLQRLVTERAREPEEQLASAEREAVTLMTIHGAKGLEFPVVFLPELAAAPPSGEARSVHSWHAQAGLGVRAPDPTNGWEDRPTGRMQRARRLIREEQTAEDLRVLYVAMTRAERLLFLSGTVKGNLHEASATKFDASPLGRLLPALGVTGGGDLNHETLDPPWAHEQSPRVLTVKTLRELAPTRAAEHPSLPLPVAIPKKVIERTAPLELRLDSLRPVSVTSLNLFSRCPNRVLLDRVGINDEMVEEAIIPGGDEGSSRSLGNIYHALVEQRLRHPTLAVAELIERLRAQMPHPPDEGDLRRAEALLLRFKAMPLWERIQRASVLHPEHAAVLNLPSGPLRCRLDLLMQCGDAWEVIDHKTSSAEGTDVDLLAPHRVQMECYLLCLRAQFPAQNRLRVTLAFPRGEREVVLERSATEVDALRAPMDELTRTFKLRQGQWHHAFPRAECKDCPHLGLGLCERFGRGAGSD